MLGEITRTRTIPSRMLIRQDIRTREKLPDFIDKSVCHATQSCNAQHTDGGVLHRISDVIDRRC
jgi:hypothetical protein